jgi:hypothetical protein
MWDLGWRMYSRNPLVSLLSVPDFDENELIVVRIHLFRPTDSVMCCLLSEGEGKKTRTPLRAHPLLERQFEIVQDETKFDFNKKHRRWSLWNGTVQSSRHQGVPFATIVSRYRHHAQDTRTA